MAPGGKCRTAAACPWWWLVRIYGLRAAAVPLTMTVHDLGDPGAGLRIVLHSTMMVHSHDLGPGGGAQYGVSVVLVMVVV